MSPNTKPHQTSSNGLGKPKSLSGPAKGHSSSTAVPTATLMMESVISCQVKTAADLLPFLGRTTSSACRVTQTTMTERSYTVYLILSHR